jgi:hypothetical protein
MIVVAAQEGFYEVAAQVIPVLLLVLVLGEGGIIRTDRGDLQPRDGCLRPGGEADPPGAGSSADAPAC